MTRQLDPQRDDAGVRLRTARLRRGMPQTTLAELARVSPAYISMIETGQRQLTRLTDVVALASALNVSPLYLAAGREDTSHPAVPFPARTDPHALTRHQHLARQFTDLARQDTRTAGDWLRRLARDPTTNPWLLLDQLVTLPGGPSASLHANGSRKPGENGHQPHQIREECAPAPPCHPRVTADSP